MKPSGSWAQTWMLRRGFGPPGTGGICNASCENYPTVLFGGLRRHRRHIAASVRGRRGVLRNLSFGGRRENPEWFCGTFDRHFIFLEFSTSIFLAPGHGPPRGIDLFKVLLGQGNARDSVTCTACTTRPVTRVPRFTVYIVCLMYSRPPTGPAAGGRRRPRPRQEREMKKAEAAIEENPSVTRCMYLIPAPTHGIDGPL